MKLELCLLVIASFVAIAITAPQATTEPIAIISQEFEQEADGSYTSNFETANGISANEVGTLKKATSNDTSDVIITSGSYSYTSPEGEVITVTYVADDEGGFQPTGDHLPTPPPVPPAIQKAVDLLLSMAAKRR